MTRALKLGNLFNLNSWSHMTSVTIMPVPVAYNDAIHFFNSVGVLQLHTIDTTMEISACRFFTFDFLHLFKIKICMYFLLQQRREQSCCTWWKQQTDGQNRH